MIRAAAETTNGMMIILGVTEANLERLRDDQPIHLNLGDLLVEAHKDAGRAEGKLELSIIYGKTHREIVDMFTKHGIELPPGTAEQADAIDASL